MSQANVLALFNSIVVDENSILDIPSTDLINIGVVTNFKPNNEVLKIIQDRFQPLPMTTLFDRTERLAGDLFELITKQLLHYIEVYGLGAPGLFELEVHDGVIIKPTFIKGITRLELQEKIQTLLYANAPIKELVPIKEIIKDFSIEYDFSKIANNEARIVLYDPACHSFSSGDDAVRYMVYIATGETTVIKNKKIQSAIALATFNVDFFIKNENVLAEVFNRFKPLILAAKRTHLQNNGAFAKLATLAKTSEINTVINRISRKSKTMHKPVYESLSKRFLSEAVKTISSGTFESFSSNVKKLNVRDKFKLLNLIEYKTKGYSTDSFIIRNGTIHVEPNRAVIQPLDLAAIRQLILFSLIQDLSFIKDKTILLDENVDYGLPISRKQTVGNLPFGTTVTINDGDISSGIYWHNDGGASDLDLSTVDLKGNRVGWGSLTGYNDKNIIFSGDVTWADNGAMEFMTSNSMTYGLFVNIFSGMSTAEFELVVGKTSEKQWITDCVVREKSKLTGRGSIVGLVEGNKFKVFQGRLNDRIANFNEGSPVINRATGEQWTVRKLFDAIGIKYDIKREENKEYDFSLSYDNFSFDKLEQLLYK
jgi:hypothetical protein